MTFLWRLKIPLLNHKNLGEIQKTAYLTATITSVDSGNDTASFTGIGDCPSGTDIPIFYHCEPDSVKRDNGALEDAAGAFEEDDEVIIQCEVVDSTTYKPLYIMGFVDKPKACAFYIDVTVNEFVPAYYKTLKIIDAEGIVHIQKSTPEEPGKVGPFQKVAFPAKVYLYMDGNAPGIGGDSQMLFSYFTENPVKEFTVKVETWVEESTITVNGITLGNGDQQKFSWDYGTKTWSPVQGGIGDDTTLFMAPKRKPTSSGYNQACKKEVVNAYEGTRILLTGGDGNPQTMEEIYDYCFSAKKVHNTFHGCDTYRPYYGLVENLPVYGPPYESVVEDLYYLNAWRVAYLLMDDNTIDSKPLNPVNFTATRLGSLMTKDTLPPVVCSGCEWTVEEKTWTENVEDIKYDGYPQGAAYLIVSIHTFDGFHCYDVPHDCEKSGNDNVPCGDNIWWSYYEAKEIGTVTLPQMGIMSDSDGKNIVFEEVSLNVDHIAQVTYMYFSGGESICERVGGGLDTKRYEFQAIPTPEHRI